MGEFADTLKKQHHSDQMVSIVSKAEDIGMMVSGAQAYYGSAKALGAQLGLWDADGPLDGVMNALNDLKKAIDTAVQTLLDESFERAIDDLAQTHLVLSKDSENAMMLLRGTSDGSLSEDGIREEITYLTDPSHYLKDDTWKLYAFPGAFHDDPWSGRLAPPLESGDRVFMLMIVLPGYMSALARWLTAYAAVYPDPFKNNFKGEVEKHVARLVELHDKWLKGIYPLRVPTLDEILPATRLAIPFPRPGDQWSLFTAAWDLADRLFGAVDSFSLVASIAPHDVNIPSPPEPADYRLHLDGQSPPDSNSTFNPNAPPPSSTPQPGDPPLVTDDYKKAYDKYRADVGANFYPTFARRLIAMNLREQKVVYNQLPLDCMWRMQNTMRGLMGKPLVRKSSSPGHWSLREFDDVTWDGASPGGDPYSFFAPLDELADAAGSPTDRNEDKTTSVRELNLRMGHLAFGPTSLRAIFQDPDHRVR